MVESQVGSTVHFTWCWSEKTLRSAARIKKSSRETNATVLQEWCLLIRNNSQGKITMILIQTLNRKRTTLHGLKLTPNDEYENFVAAHIKAAAEYPLTKPRTKSASMRVNSRKKRKKWKNYVYLIKETQQKSAHRYLKNLQREITHVTKNN